MDILSPGVFIGTWRHLYVGLFPPFSSGKYIHTYTVTKAVLRREGGEDFRKDNVLIKIQKQIDKSTVQTPVHLGVF